MIYEHINFKNALVIILGAEQSVAKILHLKSLSILSQPHPRDKNIIDTIPYYYISFFFLLIFPNHYAPVSQANWCNMTFTDSYYTRDLLLFDWCDLSQASTRIWTQISSMRGRWLTNWTIPPPTISISILSNHKGLNSDPNKISQ